MLKLIETESDNAFLRRKKKSLSKKFKPTQSKTIEEANALAVYLIVLERLDEAHQLLASYAEQIPYVEHRWERWEATCKAILLLSFLESGKDNETESNRLCQIVLNQDYEIGRDDKQKLFWETIEGFNAAQSLIDHEELGQNDICMIYAETFQSFIYFQQLGSAFGIFKETDNLVTQSNMTDLKAKLSSALS